MICGQSYGLDTLQKLRPFLMNVYLQNHRLDPDGPEVIATYCRGDVRYHLLDPWESGGVDTESMFRGLQEIGYDGYFTIHQAQGIQTAEEALAFASHCAEFVRHRNKGVQIFFLKDPVGFVVLETGETHF